MEEKIGIAEPRLIPPALFFTLADKCSHSVCVLLELCRIFSEKYPETPLPECRLFFTADEIRRYLQERHIDPQCAVALFDTPYSGGRCFFPLNRGEKKRGVSLPSWSPAQWGVAISTRLNNDRHRSAACQIAADFLKHFSKNLADGALPWGNRPSASRSGRRKRERRNSRRRRRDSIDFTLACAT
jgi:hypothetical protein